MSKLVEKTVDVSQKSPEQELEELKNNELWLKEQIKQPDSLLRDMYSTDSPKKDVIVKWAENLERQHELEEKLERPTTLKSVGEISSYIKSQLRDLGVHKSTFSYVHEVLGYKYKNEKYDTSEKDENEGDAEHRQISSNLIADFDQENASIIETINQQIEFLKNFRTKARSSHILSLLNSKQLLEYEETNLRIQATQLLADQLIDDRQSVPLHAQLKLIMAVVGSTNNFAAGMYVSQIKQFGANKMIEAKTFFNKTSKPAIAELSKQDQKLFEKTFDNTKILRKKIAAILKKKKESPTNLDDVMTSKQAMKIVYGIVKRVLAVFDHKTRDEAMLDGFYGIMCPECGSFRVREKEHPDSHEWLCFCYKCEWWFEAKTVTKCWHCHLPLFEDILEIVLRTSVPAMPQDGQKESWKEETGPRKSSCPRCKEDLLLPKKMFQKPVLRGK